MNEELMQKIYEVLDNYLPEKWNKVVFRAEYFKDNFGMKYYVSEKDGEYVNCYKLKNFSQKGLMDCFFKLDAIIKPEWNKLKDKWSVFIFTFDKTGKFNVKFDYTDISENSIEYLLNWEKEYFRGNLI